MILGGSGLIGHKLWYNLKDRFNEVYATLHRDEAHYRSYGIFRSQNLIYNVDITNYEHLMGILHATNPEVVINCIGITKRKKEIADIAYALQVNSVFPHLLARWARDNGTRLIHFSTDCVFNGASGNYTEESPTNAEDTYGKTKALGEVRYDGTLTIRSSFIGRELEGKTELLEWFLAQSNRTIKGFHNALYSGVSTTFMARVVGDIIEKHTNLSGLYQLSSSQPISKFDLLHIAAKAFKLPVEIKADWDFVNINTLNGSKLHAILGYVPPRWEEMLDQLATEEIYK
jgi:dTDP-4-dehydrorhamnose reductase